MYKKLIALLLSIMLIFGTCAVAFAAEAVGSNGLAAQQDVEDPDPEPGDIDGAGDDDSDYDYLYDDELYVMSDVENGEFAYGIASKCLYNIIDGEAYTLAEASELGYIDQMGTTLPSRGVESITIVAIYAMRCPSCGKANAADSIFSIYSSNGGKCVFCDTKLPYHHDVPVYRFITVDLKSVHFDTFSGMNFARRCRKIFDSTADLYGDGKDLPQSYLIYQTETTTDSEGKETTTVHYDVIEDFKTSGLATSSFMSLLWDALTKYAYRQDKHINNETVIKIYDFMAKVTVAIIEFNGKVFRFFPTLIF